MRLTTTTLLLTLFTLFPAQSAIGADSAARKQLQQRSMESGIGKPQVPLLQVKAGPGRDAALRAVKQRLAQNYERITLSGTVKTDANNNKAIAQRGPGWALEVAGDGRKVRYRNFAYLDGPSNKRVAVDQRPSHEQLETKGRRFIAEQLRDLVRLGAGEELVPLFTQYQIAGGGPTTPGARREAETVAAANVVFSRTIDGVHVIGPGSKVAVMFGADGTIAGFDYDWPEYQRSTRVQKVAPITAVKERAQKLAPEEIERRGVNVDRIECGYFDRGTTRRDANAPVQSACAIFTLSRPVIDQAVHDRDPKSGHVTVAISTFVPAGETVEPDPAWSLAQKHLGRPYTGPQPPKDGPRRAQ